MGNQEVKVKIKVKIKEPEKTERTEPAGTLAGRRWLS